jgi:hypothetical protein
MNNCEICGKKFRDKFNLNTHKARKKPCIKIESTEINLIDNGDHFSKQNEHLDKQINHLENIENSYFKQNEHLDKQINHPESTPKNDNTCEYCFHTFFNKQSLSRHYNVCKAQEDPLRQLEILLKIQPCLPKSASECRFCNKVVSTASRLYKHFETCKKRKEYFDELEQQKNAQNKEQKRDIEIQSLKEQTEYLKMELENLKRIKEPVVQNNYNNYIQINIQGQNDPYVNIDNILNKWEKESKYLEEKEDYRRAGMMINSYEICVRENPSNRNVILKNPKSIYIDVFTDEGWVKKQSDIALQEEFRYAASGLFKIKDLIRNHNPTIYKSITTKESWTHVERFGKRGFNHTGPGDSSRLVKSTFKIGLLN